MNKGEGKMLEVASRVQELLEIKGWSQAELARRAGMPKSHVTKILHADANLTLTSIASLEDAFEESIMTVPSTPKRGQQRGKRGGTNPK